MSMKMQAIEPQNPEPNETPSGEYPIVHHKAERVQIPVEKVEPEELPVFSSRETLVDPNELAPVSSPVESGQRKTARQTAKLLASFEDERFESEDLNETMQAWDDQISHKEKLTKEVEHHILEENRSVAHFNLTRRSRGFFTKLADVGRYIWSGATPEESRKGLQGFGGVRGMFLSQTQRHEELYKRAGIEPKELKNAPGPQPEVKPVKTLKTATAPVQMQPSFASKITASIGGFFKGIFKSPAVRRVVSAGVVLGGVTVAGASSCGKDCNGFHDGHQPYGPVASATSSANSGEGGAAQSADTVAEAPSAAPTASEVAVVDPAPTVAPVPQLDKEEKSDDNKKPVAKVAPQKAKISTLPKTSVLPKESKAEPKKEVALELKDCKDDAKMKDSDLGKCLVKAEDADKLRTGLYAQVEEQKKALEGVFAPIQQGPAFVSMNPYQKDSSPVDFFEAAGVQKPSKDGVLMPVNAQADINKANKKIVADALTKASGLIAEAKTPKDFYAITELLANIGIRIDSLIAERGKQVAGMYNAANIMNAEMAKQKIDDVEKHAGGRKVDVVPMEEKKDGGTVTRSTIDIPVTRSILTGNETEMIAPVTGDDPDKVIASVQKKLDYYRGLLMLNKGLDDVRVKQRPATARAMDVMGKPAVTYKAAPGVSRKVVAYAQ